VSIKLTFRKSNISDLDQIMQIINDAKAALKEMKVDQWQDNNSAEPSEITIREDIKSGISYVIEQCGTIVLGHGVLLFGIEPTYKSITGGAWHSNQPYAVIHRVATSKLHKQNGVSLFLFENFERVCLKNNIDWLRIDTHKDNVPMLKLIEKTNYKKSGIIYLDSGAERIAFEKCLSKK